MLERDQRRSSVWLAFSHYPGFCEWWGLAAMVLVHNSNFLFSPDAMETAHFLHPAFLHDFSFGSASSDSQSRVQRPRPCIPLQWGAAVSRLAVHLLSLCWLFEICILYNLSPHSHKLIFPFAIAIALGLYSSTVSPKLKLGEFVFLFLFFFFLDDFWRNLEEMPNLCGNSRSTNLFILSVKPWSM